MSKLDKIARILAWLGFLIATSALVLQASQTIPASMAKGRSFVLSLLFFFAFFTVLSNIATALCLAAQIFPARALRFFRSRQTAGAITTAMAVVGLVYHFLLSHLWVLEGLNLLCDRLMHYVMPAITVLWWLTSATGETTWKRAYAWLVYPLVYLALVYVRWAFVHEVPYPFLEPALGAKTLTVAIIGICGLFIAMAAIVVAADKGLARLKQA